LPSTEPDKKAFSFDIIPASSIENIVIYKTPMAELPADFTGGLVKVMTKDYPSKQFTEISVSSTSNTITTGKNFYGTWYQGNYEPFGFFDKYRSIPDAYIQNRGSSFINLTSAEKQRITKLFPNSYRYDQLGTSLPSISASISGGNSYILKNNAKVGLLYMFGYGNGRKVSERNRTDYMLNGDLQYDNNTTVYDRRNNVSGLINLAYSKGKSKFTFKGLFNNEFNNTLGLRNGYDVSNRPETFDYKSYNSEFSANGLLSLVLDGTHSLHRNLNLDWTGSVSETYKNQPDQKIISFRTPFDQKAPYFIKIGNENSPEIRNAGRIFSDLHERIYSFNLNLTYNFKLNAVQQKLKMGTMNYYRDRNTTVDALGYASLDFRGTTIVETEATNFSNIFSPSMIDGFKLTLATIGNNSTSYNANALLNAGYVMWDGKFNENLKFAAGARAENYNQKLLALNQPNIQLLNFDVLPSFLVTYKVGEKSNFRFAASESLNRPEFRELASYSVFDYDNFMVIRGNPDLKRSLVKNADIRYESYPKSGEIFSVSVFYKLFNDPIEQVNSGNDVLSYRNADKATTYGAEIELRKKLDFIGNGVFENMIFYSNLSYMLGNVQFNGNKINSPLQGQSPYIINGSLSYVSQKDFSVSVLYNRVGPRLKFRAVNGAAFNIYEMPRDLIDFQMTQKLMKGKAELKLAVIDLLAQPFRWYYKFDENPENNFFDASKDKVINSFKFGTIGQ
ncbi:MAG: TonB-dependent receptor domain-containing protein, partial [Chitinophagaceae bacterium]